MQILSTLVRPIVDLVGYVFGSRKERDQQSHGEQMSVYSQYAAEFRNLSYRTWFDSLIDGINRLPRPMMTFGVMYIFYWCASDPESFTESMIALQAMPEYGWLVLSAIIGFWFGTKFIEKLPHRGVKPEDVRAMLERSPDPVSDEQPKDLSIADDGPKPKNKPLPYN